MDDAVVFTSAFIVLWLWRYVRLIVHLLASWTFQPIMPAMNPCFTPKDVTVVVAALTGEGNMFRQCLDSILANNPCEVIVATPFHNAPRLAYEYRNNPKVRVIGSRKTNKRFQQTCGILKISSPITVFADDDVIWPATFLHAMLAAFEDPAVGAAGSCQRLAREKSPTIWNFLGSAYLERRNFEFSATMHLDGGTSALSGRTQVIRSHIIQDKEFINAYNSEYWMNMVPLSGADDDNFITRWLVNHDWKIRIQYCKEAEILTTLENGPRFLSQCVRWFRTTWRSNFTSMFVERKIWRDQPWCSYALHLSTFNAPAAIMDSSLSLLLYRSVQILAPTHVRLIMVAFGVWLLFTKTVKLLPHFWRYPTDIRFIPLHIIFGYFHGFIKIYALLTINKTNWGGRLVPKDLEPLLDDYEDVHLGPTEVTPLVGQGTVTRADSAEVDRLVGKGVLIVTSKVEPERLRAASISLIVEEEINEDDD